MTIEQDAKRWQYARQFLSIQDVENWEVMASHTPDEAESKRADTSVDSAIERIQGGK